MAYSPLAVGLLSGAYRRGEPPPAGSLWARRPPERFEQALDGRAGDTLDAVHDIATRAGATPAQVALAWVLSNPEVTVAISGADSDAQMDENLGALTLQLAPQDLARLTEVSAPAWPPRIA